MDCCQGQQTWQAEEVTVLRLSLLVDQRSHVYHLHPSTSVGSPIPRHTHMHLIPSSHLRSRSFLISILALSAPPSVPREAAEAPSIRLELLQRCGQHTPVTRTRRSQTMEYY